MPDPTIDDLLDRLVGLAERQTEILTRLAAIVAPEPQRRRTTQVCADELRAGDKIVSLVDPDLVNVVVRRPEWVQRWRTVQLRVGTGDGIVERVADADEVFTVEEPRPDPVWADDPFGTPTTLAVCPWRSDPCDGGSLPREARR